MDSRLEFQVGNPDAAAEIVEMDSRPDLEMGDPDVAAEIVEMDSRPDLEMSDPGVAAEIVEMESQVQIQAGDPDVAAEIVAMDSRVKIQVGDPDVAAEIVEMDSWSDLEMGDPDVVSRAASVADQINGKLPKSTVEENRAPSIWKVPPHLRKSDEDAYEPMLVSIGPLHHGQDKLLPMEDVKLAYVHELLQRHPKNRLEMYVYRTLTRLRQARAEYSQEIDFSDEKLAKILVVDGCFMIEYFVRRLLHRNHEMPFLPEVQWRFSYLNRDLMLLENQIPFFVLTDILKLTRIPLGVEDLGTLAELLNMQEKRELDLMMLALPFLGLKLPKGKYPEQNSVRHLLHLRQLCMDPKHIDIPSGWFSCQPCILKLRSKLKNCINFLVNLIFFRLFCTIFRDARKWKYHGMIPCATELLEAGIEIKRKDLGEWESAGQFKVSFSKGKLEIPFLSVSDDTNACLRNLIALEQCSSIVQSPTTQAYDEANHVTSYCVLMSNIIKTAEDVAILRDEGVLENMLSADKAVAQLFNGLFKQVHLDIEGHCNADLFRRVREYCGVVHHRWRAELYRKGWKSPWTLCALVGGILLLAIAATQLYFTASRRR